MYYCMEHGGTIPGTLSDSLVCVQAPVGEWEGDREDCKCTTRTICPADWPRLVTALANWQLRLGIDSITLGR